MIGGDEAEEELMVMELLQLRVIHMKLYNLFFQAEDGIRDRDG